MVNPNNTKQLSGNRGNVAKFVESTPCVTFITTIILINAITLGLETDTEIYSKYGKILYWIDKTILIFFTIELSLKFYAYRLGFFKSGWNLFDFIIVTIAWIPTAGPLAILRAFRILRVLRLLSIVPQMRRVISAIGHSIPGMMSVIGVLSIVFYVSSVLTTKLFGYHPEMQEWFGSVGASAYTLFQIMTLESWSMGIVRPVMEIFPWAWVFFVPFIIITSFAVLNLFIGIIVDAMQQTQKETRKENTAENTSWTQSDLASIHERFNQLQQEIANLKTHTKPAQEQK